MVSQAIIDQISGTEYAIGIYWSDGRVEYVPVERPFAIAKKCAPPTKEDSREGGCDE